MKVVKKIIKKLLACILPKSSLASILDKYSQYKTKKEYKKFYSNFILHKTAPIDTTNTPYFSQYGQDWFLSTRCFPQSTNGYFLDIGANLPEYLSNTLFFEKMGWNGLAFEPITELCELWKEARTTRCLPIALGDCNKEIIFKKSSTHQLSHVTSTKNELSPDFASSYEDITIQQNKISDILSAEGIINIDFVSLDVEGYEINVLKGFDFNKVNVKYFLIENNGTTDEKQLVRDFMQKNNFVYIARIVIDDVFCHKNEIKNYERNLNKNI